MKRSKKVIRCQAVVDKRGQGGMSDRCCLFDNWGAFSRRAVVHIVLKNFAPVFCCHGPWGVFEARTGLTPFFIIASSSSAGESTEGAMTTKERQW